MEAAPRRRSSSPRPARQGRLAAYAGRAPARAGPGRSRGVVLPRVQFDPADGASGGTLMNDVAVGSCRVELKPERWDGTVAEPSHRIGRRPVGVVGSESRGRPPRPVSCLPRPSIP